MQNVKRLEIIIDTPELPALTTILRQQGVSGYSVFHGLSGSGFRGERRNDEPDGGSGNACVLLAAPAEQIGPLIEAIRPIISQRGGICLVSDAQWVIH